MTKTIYVEQLPDYGDLMTVKDWLDSCECGAFIDYDGHGYPVKGKKMSKTQIIPSEREKLPKDATHVMWFNR